MDTTTLGILGIYVALAGMNLTMIIFSIQFMRGNRDISVEIKEFHGKLAILQEKHNDIQQKYVEVLMSKLVEITKKGDE